MLRNRGRNCIMTATCNEKGNTDQGSHHLSLWWAGKLLKTWQFDGTIHPAVRMPVILVARRFLGKRLTDGTLTHEAPYSTVKVAPYLRVSDLKRTPRNYALLAENVAYPAPLFPTPDRFCHDSWSSWQERLVPICHFDERARPGRSVKEKTGLCQQTIQSRDTTTTQMSRQQFNSLQGFNVLVTNDNW